MFDAKLLSADRRIAKEAAKELVASGPSAFPTIRIALREPRLENSWEDLIYDLGKLGGDAVPMTSDVLRFLDLRAGGSACRRYAAHVLGKFGDGAHSEIRTWMETHPIATWGEVAETLFFAMTAAETTEFFRGSIGSVSANANFRLWVCRFIAEQAGFTNVDREIVTFESLVPELLRCLPDVDPWIHDAAIDAIAAIGEPALGTMWSMTESPQPVLRVAGLDALARYVTQFSWSMNSLDRKAGDSLSALAAKLADSDAAVRVAAAVTLQKIAVAISNDALAAESETTDPELQIRIAEGHRDCVLTPTGRERVQRAIHGWAYQHHEYQSTRRRIAAVDLATSADVEIDETSPLLDGLRDWHDPWRSDYLRAIQFAIPRSKALIPGIIVCTAGEHPLQVLALETLGKMRVATDEVVDRVIVCLKASHRDVREAAAVALGEFGPCKIEAVIALINAVNDEASGICGEACRTLGKMRKAAAAVVPEIVAVANRLGRDAVETLGQIGTDDARTAVWNIYHQSRPIEDGEYDAIGDEARRWLEKWSLLPCGSH